MIIGSEKATLNRDIELNGAKAKAGAHGCVYLEDDGILVFNTIEFEYDGLTCSDECAEFIVTEADIRRVS